MSDYSYRRNLQNGTSELRNEYDINNVVTSHNDLSQSSEDIKRAQQIVGPDIHVHFALRPIPEASSSCYLCCSKLPLPFFWLPCIWPHLLVLSIMLYLPLYLYLCKDEKNSLQNTLYILTDTSIIIDVEDHTSPCCVCCCSRSISHQSTNLRLETISVEKSTAWKFCCEGTLCEEVPKVLISKLNPHIWYDNEGNYRQEPDIPLYVRNPDEVIRQINDVKTAQSAAAKRIFVSVHSNPTDFKIVILKGSTAADWNRFLEEARDALGIPPDKAGCMQVTLDQTTIAVKGASELEAGDKVVLRYC